jgi:RNA polymerase sigma-54 factor
MFSNQHLQDNRHQATAHLAKTMSYLQLSSTELEAALLKEIDQNPALEIVEELRCPGCGRRLRRLPCPTCAAPNGDGAPVVFLSPREPGTFRPSERDSGDPPDVRMPERLDEFILRQIGPALSREERPVAAYILAQLDENGFFREAEAEVAAYKRVSLRMVERILGLIQHAEPLGVGAASAQACLLIQVDSLIEAGQVPEHLRELVRALIQDHFEGLGKMEYEHIARRLRAQHNWHVSPTAIALAVDFIHRNLTPYPARAYWGDGRAALNADGAVLHAPDVSITVLNEAAGGGLAVEVFAPLSGWLRVNPEFKAAVAECTGEERERWLQTVAEAALVTKCLQQRNHTMRRLMEVLALAQRDFILGGDGDLRPTTRVQIAQLLGLHESTISRAVAGKSVALPDGRVIQLAKFFDRSLSVRDRVRSIIQSESRPLTDDDIAEALARQGVNVARRTVAKYRKMLGILPANVRGRQARQQRSTARALAGRPRDARPLPTPVVTASA